MSTLIVRCLCPNYEDYERYGIESNAYSGFPELWPEERYAEGALWVEHKRMREEYAMLRRYNQLRRELHKDNIEYEEVNEQALPTLVRALISIAKENGWKVKNQELVDVYGISTVYTIPPMSDEEEMPMRWNDIIRWMDRQKTKQEKAEEEAEKLKAEQAEQRRRDVRITLDAALLKNIIGDLMPGMFIEKRGKHIAFVKHTPHSRMELQEIACALLAEENGWKMNDPWGGETQIYKIA